MLRPFYIREMYWLAYQLQTKADELFKKYPVNDGVYASAEISGLDLVYSLLSDAARLNGLLIAPEGSKKIYRERADRLFSLIKDLQLVALLDKKVRNTIEHFGEYLDDHNLQQSSFSPSKRYLVVSNFIFSHMERLNFPDMPVQLFASPVGEITGGIPICPVRVYVVSTRTFHNFSWSVSISALRDEAVAITNALKPFFEEKNPEDWVTQMVIIGPSGT